MTASSVSDHADHVLFMLSVGAFSISFGDITAACDVQVEVSPDTPSLGVGLASLMLTFSQSYPDILAFWSM